jgi:hypothetical protein
VEVVDRQLDHIVANMERQQFRTMQIDEMLTLRMKSLKFLPHHVGLEFDHHPHDLAFFCEKVAL